MSVAFDPNSLKSNKLHDFTNWVSVGKHWQSVYVYISNLIGELSSSSRECSYWRWNWSRLHHSRRACYQRSPCLYVLIFLWYPLSLAPPRVVRRSRNSGSLIETITKTHCFLDITGRRLNILQGAAAKFEAETGLSERIIPYQCDVGSKEQILGELAAIGLTN
jgi:hypothetical protein